MHGMQHALPEKRPAISWLYALKTFLSHYVSSAKLVAGQATAPPAGQVMGGAVAAEYAAAGLYSQRHDVQSLQSPAV